MGPITGRAYTRQFTVCEVVEELFQDWGMVGKEREIVCFVERENPLHFVGEKSTVLKSTLITHFQKSNEHVTSLSMIAYNKGMRLRYIVIVLPKKTLTLQHKYTDYKRTFVDPRIVKFARNFSEWRARDSSNGARFHECETKTKNGRRKSKIAKKNNTYSWPGTGFPIMMIPIAKLKNRSQ